MALKIRLRQQGRRNRLFYRLVVADCRSPRDGRFVETLGWYNPVDQAEGRHFSVEEERIQHWLDQGAQFTESAENLVGRAAPELLKRLRERQAQRRVVKTAKRRASRQACADKA